MREVVVYKTHPRVAPYIFVYVLLYICNCTYTADSGIYKTDVGMCVCAFVVVVVVANGTCAQDYVGMGYLWWEYCSRVLCGVCVVVVGAFWWRLEIWMTEKDEIWWMTLHTQPRALLLQNIICAIVFRFFFFFFRLFYASAVKKLSSETMQAMMVVVVVERFIGAGAFP